MAKSRCRSVLENYRIEWEIWTIHIRGDLWKEWGEEWWWEWEEAEEELVQMCSLWDQVEGLLQGPILMTQTRKRKRLLNSRPFKEKGSLSKDRIMKVKMNQQKIWEQSVCSNSGKNDLNLNLIKENIYVYGHCWLLPIAAYLHSLLPHACHNSRLPLYFQYSELWLLSSDLLRGHLEISSMLCFHLDMALCD